jgi:hypothetical protein
LRSLKIKFDKAEVHPYLLIESELKLRTFPLIIVAPNPSLAFKVFIRLKSHLGSSPIVRRVSGANMS